MARRYSRKRSIRRPIRRAKRVKRSGARRSGKSLAIGHAMPGFFQPAPKYYLYGVTPTTIPITAGADTNAYPINLVPPQGTTNIPNTCSRNGRNMLMKSIYIRYFLDAQAPDAGTFKVRLMLVYDKGCATLTTTPPYSDVIDDAVAITGGGTITATEGNMVRQYKEANRQRFDVLLDKLVTVWPQTYREQITSKTADAQVMQPSSIMVNDGNPHNYGTIYKKLTRPTSFIPGAGYSMAECEFGALYLYVIGANSTTQAATDLKIRFTSKLFFEDMQ